MKTLFSDCRLKIVIYKIRFYKKKKFSSVFQSIRAVTPLCENMPGSRATKPGDVVTAMNGKTIQV
jgi:leucyl aminopeptidase